MLELMVHAAMQLVYAVHLGCLLVCVTNLVQLIVQGH
jgi:hypothetical protein